MSKMTALVVVAGVAAGVNAADIGMAVSYDALNDNFVSETITVAPGYDGNGMLDTWGGGDMFGITSRPLAAPSPNGMPFAMADDSDGSFPADSQGIITTNDLGRFFGVVDSVNGANPAGNGVAEWSFNVAGFSNLSLAIDFAAMGDFEDSSPTNDSHLFEYQIDGGGFNTLFASSVDTAGNMDYTMAGGGVFNLNDPMLMNGTMLNNVFQSLSAAIAGTGSTLDIRYTGGADGGSEAFAFRNMVLSGVPTPGTAALIGLGGLVAIRRRR